MLRVVNLESKFNIKNQREVETLISDLREKGHVTTIRSSLNNIFELANLPEPNADIITNMIEKNSKRHYLARSSAFMGDIFVNDEVIYVLNPERSHNLQISAIGYEKPEESIYNFCKDVEESFKTKFPNRSERFNFDWKMPDSSISHLRDSFIDEELLDEELTLEKIQYNKPEYTSEDIEMSNLLVDVQIRKFILKLAQVSKITSEDAYKIVETEVINKLLSSGLIAEEYLLLCKKDQHTICVVSSKDHFSQYSNPPRCSICGRSFADENLQTIYTLTSEGKRLIDGSLWMTIWITEILKENGIMEENIKWNIEVGGEELDIMIEDFDSRIFFELKDREFGLGDAYPFILRVKRYGGNMGIVATMDKVATNVKNFFEEENNSRNSISIEYYEGNEDIREGIQKIITRMTLFQLRRTIRPISDGIGINLWPFVDQWIQNIRIPVNGTNIEAINSNEQ